MADWLNKLLSRRAAVGLGVRGAAVLGLGGALQVTGNRDKPIRPPGALDEDEFLAVCIRCDRCMLVCPYDLIHTIPITESAVQAGTPTMHGYCPRCRLCIYACPVGALRNDRP